MRYRSDKYIVGGGGGHVEDLEEGGAQDDEEEDAQQPWTDLAGLFFLLNGRNITAGRKLLSKLASWCLLLLSFISWSFAIASK